jgi:hypothetical protein
MSNRSGSEKENGFWNLASSEPGKAFSMLL